MTFEDLTFSPRSSFMPGVRATVDFPNGYGASVIRGYGTYGSEDDLYELAVMTKEGICYSTPITDDVIGWCSPDRITQLLQEIEALPPRVTSTPEVAA